GAVSGELMAQVVMKQLYPGKEVDDLTETEKQTISALGTLAAGLAGGLAGNSTAAATTGAQAGKNAVENNTLGAMAGSDLGFWLGKTPDATAEDKAKLAGDIAKGNAIVSAGVASTVGVGALTAEQAAMWALGAGTNAGIQYANTGEVNPVNSVIAGWVNVVTMGQGWKGTVGWNAAGGALGNAITGDDPLTGAIINGAGAWAGYGIGNYVAKPIVNTAGKLITGGWNPKFNPDLLKYTEVKGQLGISKEMVPSQIPGAAGNMGASITSEMTGTELQKVINDKFKKGERE
ncbi:VENN motif pre-toxin domain-containing protein, partial [Pantoea sp. FN0305]|uniref:VENN motif pre-toxin domain-containing protein n=1 Tax=Pantoea sp. FN0305 TaxID=3418559 RepID=UPI003CF1E30C